MVCQLPPLAILLLTASAAAAARRYPECGGVIVTSKVDAFVFPARTSRRSGRRDTPPPSQRRRSRAFGVRVVADDAADVAGAEARSNAEDDGEVPLDCISDEEAILACRAYLKRRRKLPWTKGDDRRDLEERRTRNAAGYFWEDPAELAYLNPGRRRRAEGGAEDWTTADATMLPGDDPLEEDDEEENEDDDERIGVDESGSGGEFTSFPLYPPEERKRRSSAAKKTWADSSFRKRWYESRWGHGKADPTPSRTRRLRSMVRNVPREVLQSPELASLSEEELSDAIRTYVKANRKRSQSHRAIAKDHRKWDLERVKDGAEMFERESSEEGMRKAREERAERARKAYRTRVANLEKARRADASVPLRTSGTEHTKKSGSPRKAAQIEKKRRSSDTAAAMTPKHAMEAIASDLESNVLPSSSDVRIILVPIRLAGRRDLLRKVLSQCFGLRGRCVPSVLDGMDDETFGDDEADLTKGGDLLFVTKCTVHQLGSFVIRKLQEVEAIERS